MIEPFHISSRLCSGVDKKTAQALHAVGGRPNWWSKELEADKSGYSAEDKILKITRAHESMMHLGGREGAVKLLHEAKVKWKNMDLDCAFLLRRCDHCLAKTTRGVNVPERRRLPRPLAAGEILGVDLKKVTPIPGSGSTWTMLLIVCFASNRIWCYDLDDNKSLGLIPCLDPVGLGM